MRVPEHAIIRPDVLGVSGVGVGEYDDAIALRERKHERLHAGLFAEMAAPQVEEMRIALREAAVRHEAGVQRIDAEAPGSDVLVADVARHKGPRRRGVGATGGEPVVKQLVIVADKDAAEIENDGRNGGFHGGAISKNRRRFEEPSAASLCLANSLGRDAGEKVLTLFLIPL